MFSETVLAKVTQLFPDVKIDYKNNSTLMKILGKIMFIAPTFMSSYTTTVGSAIYFPSEEFVNARPESSLVILLHELVHVTDAHKLTKPLFGFLYLSPQILIFAAALLFLISWKVALPLLLLFGAPVPSYFRMLFERRAYMASLYSMKKLNDKYGNNIDLDAEMKFFLTQFKGPAYYFMYPFSNLDTQFANALQKIKNNQRPYEDKVFDVLDEILAVA